MMNVRPFHPPARTLMGPGPSDVNPRVLEAMARPTIGHLDPEFVRLMDEVKELLRYAFQTENEVTMAASGPGTVGMETCFVNLVEPGDKVVVCVNGVFGGRMKENVERCVGTVVVVEEEWGRAVNPEKVEESLAANPDAVIVAFVHAETSTGAVSDARTLVNLAHRYDCLAIVDAVTSLGGIPVQVDEWGIDAVYSGSQKCLSCTPGLSPVSFNARAVAKVRNRKTRVQSWFMDLNLVLEYWGERRSVPTTIRRPLIPYTAYMRARDSPGRRSSERLGKAPDQPPKAASGAGRAQAPVLRSRIRAHAPAQRRGHSRGSR
jgi:alanine-glyoxylate transaminase/serine-glyoxylate transaminase/serine-pyruvate transaminase